MSPGIDDGVGQGPLLGSRAPADADSSRRTAASRAGEFYASPAPYYQSSCRPPPVEEGVIYIYMGGPSSWTARARYELHGPRPSLPLPPAGSPPTPPDFDGANYVGGAQLFGGRDPL